MNRKFLLCISNFYKEIKSIKSKETNFLSKKMTIDSRNLNLNVIDFIDIVDKLINKIRYQKSIKSFASNKKIM